MPEHPPQVLVGDRRHFPAALIAPNFRALAERLRLDEPAVRSRVGADDVRTLYQAVVDDVNRQIAQFERIKKFTLVPDEFSVATGELTPTLKIKRRAVLEKHREVIERMYS